MILQVLKIRAADGEQGASRRRSLRGSDSEDSEDGGAPTAELGAKPVAGQTPEPGEPRRGWGGGYGFCGLDGGNGRLLALRVVTHPAFEIAILLTIGVSSGLLLVETHCFRRRG